MPIGDVQYGSDGCDLDKLKEYIDKGLKANAMFLGMGDFHDVLSPSNRKKLMAAALYDNAYKFLEEKYMQDLDVLKEVLKPTKGRWLGMLEGHHFFEFSDGATTDTELCRFLNAPFLGTCGFMRLFFNNHDAEGKRRGKGISCDIWCHHGTGGGTTVGAVLNKLERVAGSFDADLYFMGHANRLSAAPKPFLELGGKEANLYLKNRDRYLVATGAFDKGYMVNSTAGRTGRPRGGYVEQGMMLPTGLGAAMVRIEPKHKEVATQRNGIVVSRADYIYLDISVTI